RAGCLSELNSFGGHHRPRSTSAGNQAVRRATVLISVALLACGRKPVPDAPATPWFADVAAETGLQFTHITGATGRFYMPEIMGAGCALLDYDGDGDLDVLLIQGAPFENPGKGPGNRLFRNELVPSGKLRFTDVTRQAGLGSS